MTKLQIKVRRGYMYYLKKTKCLCSWNLHSVLFLMQPEAMGDVEVNSAFYNVSCSLWRVLVWHALLLEWIPNWGLKSGVPLQIVVMFLDTDVVLPNYYWILKKTTKTKKKKNYNSDDCFVLVSRGCSSLVTFIWSAVAVVPLLYGAPKSIWMFNINNSPKVCFDFKIKRNANVILNQPTQGWHSV